MKALKPILLLLLFIPGLHAEVTETKLALAREAIAAVQADKMFDAMGAQLKQLAIQQVRVPLSATPEERANVQVFLDKVTDLSMNEAKAMMDKLDVVYAEVYTEEELRAMVAFFNSPEGQSMMNKQPEVMARVIPMAQEMQRKILPEIQKLAEELTAKTASAND